MQVGKTTLFSAFATFTNPLLLGTALDWPSDESISISQASQDLLDTAAIDPPNTLIHDRNSQSRESELSVLGLFVHTSAQEHGRDLSSPFRSKYEGSS
jgi:hypothetical protein